MLKVIDKTSSAMPGPVLDEERSAEKFELNHILRAGRRQAWIIILFCVLGLAIGSGYVLNAIPRFTATAVVLIEGSKDKSGISASIADLTYDSGAIDSQLEVLKSDGIAESVMTTMKLDRQPDFLQARLTPLSQFFNQIGTVLHLRGLFGTTHDNEPAQELSLQHAIINEIRSNLDVRRVGRSYVINIDYTSTDPATAAAVANGVAEAYIGDQTASKFDSMRKASGFLQQRIAELKKTSMDLDLNVQKFKSDHNLLTVDGKLVSDQQLSELSTQMILAGSDTAKAEARYEQIQKLISDNNIQGVVADTLGNPIINDLREKYLAAARLQGEIVGTLGADHPQVVNLRRTMDEYTRSIFSEMSRIAESYKSEAMVARAKEKSLHDSMTALAQQRAATSQALVELRELEREADSYRALYATFLDRFQQVQAGQSFPESEARIITPAAAPDRPSYPKRSVVIALSFIFGALAGVGVGAFREYKDDTFRIAADVSDKLRLDFLGMLPLIKKVTPIKTDGAGPRDEKLLYSETSLLRFGIDHPLTSFAETLRSLKVAIDINLSEHWPKIIGVISSSPSEGKSTVSKNLASLIAHLGAKVVLIDADLRHPGLTTLLASHATSGLLEVLQGDKFLGDALMLEPDSGLCFLPTVLTGPQHHSSQILSSTRMRETLDEAGARFDYVIVDLPPLGPVVDARAASAIFDGFIFVAEWGRTSRSMVQTTLQADREITAKCLGIVFNQVQMDKIKLYEGSGAKAFYHREFGSYYQIEE